MLRKLLQGWVEDFLFSVGYYSYRRVNKSDLSLARKVRQLYGFSLGLSPAEWVEIQYKYPRLSEILGSLMPVEDQIGKTVDEVRVDLRVLKRLASLYLENKGVSGSLQVGDLVVWKSKGLKNRQYPELGMPAVVVSVLQKQKTYWGEEKEPSDLALLTYEGGVLNVDRYNSCRFMKYQEPVEVSQSA